ncbi:integral membrane protein [Colletotrichum zoysiae]|uniref:Integral membrane protein n=1 Tax=Colletotrichum zoysiae TaxID=1216348 RepID=A0AAD9HC98_9PEZI|nr:integral membrane protein [Colletotrichum zoysiae]
MKGNNVTLSPLPFDVRHGLEAITAFAGLSLVASSALLIYLICRLALWLSSTTPRRLKSSTRIDDVVGLPRELGTPYRAQTGKRQRRVPNQFLVLVLNVLLADMIQSCAYLLSIKWLVENSIPGSSLACWVQGWLMSTGNFASTSFVTTIAVHTYLTLVRAIEIPRKVFYGVVVCLWILVLLMSVLGAIITNNGAGAGGFYVRDGLWCWINTEYETLRVTLHFMWMATLLLTGTTAYVAVFIHFQRKHKVSREKPEAAAVSKEHVADVSPSLAGPPHISTRTDKKRLDVKTRVIFLMYPLIFLLCTAPLALSHMLQSGRVNPPKAHLVLAGVMISSNGWLDVLVFSLTRGGILFDAPVGEQNVGLDTFMLTSRGQQYGYRVWVHGGPPGGSQTPGRIGRLQRSSYRPKSASEGRHDRHESQNSLRGRDLCLEGIQLETVTRVSVEEADSKTDSMSSEETVGKRVHQRVDSCT